MNLFTGESADAFFGGDVPPAVREILHRAAAAPRDEVGALLWTAQAVAPQCLAVYYTLYKHHAGRREFDQAERAATRGLQEAARQAGLPQDWRQAQPGQPPGITFSANSPARFWLFTLKALAFISLRCERPHDARALLEKIKQLDPHSGMGDDVIAALLGSVGK